MRARIPKADRLLRLSIPLFLSIVSAGAAFAQKVPEQVRLDSNETIFTVMAAIDAAGLQQGAASGPNRDIRRQVREAVLAKQPHSLEALRAFVAQHRQKDPAADVNQYFSFAVSVNGPPNFEYRFKPAEIPPDVRPLAGFETLLAQFYKEADVPTLWRRAQPAFEQVLTQLHQPITQAVFQVNGYLRNATSGYLGRQFEVYVDVLGPSSQVQSRSYRDDYAVIVTPGNEPQIDEIRHGYLHYLLDPLALKYFTNLKRIQNLAEYSSSVLTLDPAYQDDLALLTTESLIRAVESRLAPPAERAALVDRALHEGYVLAPAFAEGLITFEKQPVAMRLYFPELIANVDLKAEDKRLAAVDFSKVPPKKNAQPAAPAAPVATASAAEKTVDDAEDLYRSRDLTKAKELYTRSLEQAGAASVHARAYYGLARIATLQNDAEGAERLFNKTLESSPDDETKSWSLLYLGRLAAAEHRPEQALERYRGALAVAGAPDSVKTAAQKGIRDSSAAK